MSASTARARRLLVEPVDRHDREELVDGPRVRQRLEHREVAEVGVRRAPSPGPRAPRAPPPARARCAGSSGRCAQKSFSATTRCSSDRWPSVNRVRHSSLYSQRVVVGLQEVLARARRGRCRTGCAPPAAPSSGTLSGHSPTSNSLTPSTSMTSTAWCATTARPDSDTMVGCGTLVGVARSMHRRRRRRWRTPASCSSSTR